MTRKRPAGRANGKAYGPRLEQDSSTHDDRIPGISIGLEHFYDCDVDGNVVDEVGEGRRMLYASEPMRVRHHRDRPGPETLGVGKVSPGSLDLALNILNHLYPPACDGKPPVRCRVNVASATAYGLHEKFCARFLASMDPDGGEIPIPRIRAWVEGQTCVRGGPAKTTKSRWEDRGSPASRYRVREAEQPPGS